MSNSSLRIFNDKGIKEFHSFLEKAKAGDPSPISYDLLISDKFSKETEETNILKPLRFDTKRDFFNYLDNNISEKYKKSYYNRGLWTWLSAYYFETICPIKSGNRKVREEAKYILNVEHWGRYYRHLVAAPLRLKTELGSLSDIYLSSPPDEHGDIMEQLASRQDIAANAGVIEAATVLYWDTNAQNIKIGARNKQGAGVLRRFAKDIIPQFQMTYDLNAMTGQDILQLLPKEFDGWKPNT